MKVIFCDICGTLFYSNTTFDFIDYVVNSRKYLFFKKIFLNYCFRKINALFYHLFGVDLLKRLSIRFLKGLSKNELSVKAKEFYANYLSSHRIAESFSLVNEYRNRGYYLYLVSATLDVIAESVGKGLNADVVLSSSLYYDSKDVCTGKIKIDLFGRKWECLCKNDYDIESMLVITDDFSDLELIKQAQMVYIVTNVVNMHRWN